MRKFCSFAACTLLLSIIILVDTGCVKDSCENVRTYISYEPVYKTKPEVVANIKINAPREIKNPGKIYLFGQYIFLNDVDKGIHVIDNSNTSAPGNIGFIDIPGNMDIAVKGNTLYADLYTDLLAIDISNPKQIAVKKIVENVFPHRYYINGFVSDTNRIITDWVKKETVTVNSCEESTWFLARNNGNFFSMQAADASSAKAAASPFGIGGSMARFAIVKERMYTVGNNDLNVFNISKTTDPSYVRKINLNWGIETIFPFKDQLFIGSTSGMFIYNISNPDLPIQQAQFSHVRSCDPVIADDHHAFVTLRSGTECQGFTNQLDVLNIDQITAPTLVKTYSMTNPHGLSKDGGKLFICDGKDGLKVYDANDVKNIKLLQQIKELETYDVIAHNNTALVVAKEGLYQYGYSDSNSLRFLSKLEIAR